VPKHSLPAVEFARTIVISVMADPSHWPLTHNNNIITKRILGYLRQFIISIQNAVVLVVLCYIDSCSKSEKMVCSTTGTRDRMYRVFVLLAAPKSGCPLSRPTTPASVESFAACVSGRFNGRSDLQLD